MSACPHEYHREEASSSLVTWSAFQGACAAGNVVLARAMCDGPGFGATELHYRGEVLHCRGEVCDVMTGGDVVGNS